MYDLHLIKVDLNFGSVYYISLDNILQKYCNLHQETKILDLNLDKFQQHKNTETMEKYRFK